MNKFRYLTMLSVPILIFTTLNGHAYGQTLPRKASPKEDYASQLRQSAVYVLDSAADEVREIEDIQARVELADRIIKLLATKRPERCRQMLNALFDAALQLEKATSSNADPRRADPDAIVRKIIQLAAPLDHRLAQSYIDRYAAKEASDNGETQTTPQLSAQAAELYLRLATELIEKDPALAVSVAHRALRSAVPAQTLVFLGTLRGKDINLANSFFMAALASIKARGGDDINELLLLYAYVFSPLQVPQAVPQGLALLSIPEYRNVAKDYPVDPALARQYLAAATQILLNPERYNPPNVERLAAGARGDFFFIKIVEPQVASYLPALVSPLSARRDILFTYLQPDQRTESQASLDRWNNLHSRVNQSSGNQLETSDYYAQWAEQISDPKRKNQLYYSTVVF